MFGSLQGMLEVMVNSESLYLEDLLKFQQRGIVYTITLY